ncbi:protein Mdm4 [Xenopus laevis]|uniref:Protein Mdm4 n=3 Tax=Xenopus laevis TaxID=8355 RepID=MDM4_XENLA|nr:protein Mdm4 [Xenopus laevis]Q7ZYI3.1 RecName: Full=Protein Mdm4; AltName: Full=Double minute 4 protein; AltName: Full=Mdm2-like p53-binding protein; AltName: Full=Mdmx protein; AltName: Full=p53-binding protein Mdm4 [Xenopus laevis]AAH43773.1 Mdm4 protein [Xenopus laevis]
MSTSTALHLMDEQDPAPTTIQNTEESLVRVQPALLKILQSAGAKGDMFTLKQVMHYLGQYIMVKGLYDKQHQHIVHCGSDELGKLLGITTFSVKDPRPLYDMLKKNLLRISCTDAGHSPSRNKSQASDSLELEKSFASKTEVTDVIKRNDCVSSDMCTSFDNSHLKGNESSDYTKQSLDFIFEEWDEAGLPWWFLGNLRTNYNLQSIGSTDIPSNQDIDTATVSDTTDDMWFLNDSRTDRINMEVKMESSDSLEEEVGECDSKKPAQMIELTLYEDDDDLDDTQSLSEDTDTEVTSEECWQCTKCHKFNSPVKRYCYRCWALRKDWYLDFPRLIHSSSTPTLPGKVSSQMIVDGLDIPDCRRTVSAPMVGVQVPECRSLVPFLEPLDLAANSKAFSESTDTLLTFKAAEASLLSSRPLLEPCQLCQRRQRNGSVVHGRTAHLVTCFSCACNLKKNQKGCPVCEKPIQMVVKIYVA